MTITDTRKSEIIAMLLAVDADARKVPEDVEPVNLWDDVVTALPEFDRGASEDLLTSGAVSEAEHTFALTDGDVIIVRDGSPLWVDVCTREYFDAHLSLLADA